MKIRLCGSAFRRAVHGSRRGGVLSALPLALLASLLWAWPAAAAEPGRKIYNTRCYFCHGYSGNARTLAARFLQPPPADLTRLSPADRSRAEMIETVTRGRPGTAMKGFAGLLSASEIGAVVDFVRRAFMAGDDPNTRYHTAANGWPDHERYASAFPFATGKLPLDIPWEALDAAQRRGRRLYFAACISCHDQSRLAEPGITWEREALSYPRFDFQPGDWRRPPRALSGATRLAPPARPPQIEDLSALERQGERLFQANCAFCHGVDGTGGNWIGRFLDPGPRNLTDPEAMAGTTRADLRRVIRRGLPGTSMPAWGQVLGAAEIDALVAYISRAFHPLPKGSAAPGEKTPEPTAR